MGMARIAPVARKLREQGGFQGAKAAQPDWLRPSWDSAWQNLFARHQSESRGPLAAGRELACVMRNCVRLNYIQVIDLMNFFKYDRFSSQIYALKHPKWRPSFKLGQVARFD